jgi:hypothetical protein
MAPADLLIINAHNKWCVGELGSAFRQLQMLLYLQTDAHAHHAGAKLRKSGVLQSSRSGRIWKQLWQSKRLKQTVLGKR